VRGPVDDERPDAATAQRGRNGETAGAGPDDHDLLVRHGT
jgi:hypothetical protein